MSILGLLAFGSAPAPVLTPVTATGPTWTDDPLNGGGTWTTPTEEGVTYSPASGTADPEEAVTVTATAQPGYILQGTSSWQHTFPEASPVGPDGETWPMPTAAPWNTPEPITTPTYDGTGVSTHPDVIDTHNHPTMPNDWGGYRYWMLFTPFPSAMEENPSILVSDQAATGWHVPTGLTNPIYPWPGNNWNSDTDLTYDPATDELILVYREMGTPMVARSSDGVTWPAAATNMHMPAPSGGSIGSPALVRMGPTDWRVWSMDNDASTQRIFLRTTTDPTLTSGWTARQLCILNNFAGYLPWHIDVIHDGGVFYMLINGGASAQSTQFLWAATSTDGIEWNVDPDPIMKRGDSVPGAERPAGWSSHPYWFKWDRFRLYRSTFAPHENGTHFRVWHVGGGDLAPGATETGHRIGFVRMPRNLWPAPPA